MLFYTKNGKRYKARLENKPKFLQMKKESKVFIKYINDTPHTFYQKENNQYVHFLFGHEWFKISFELFNEKEDWYNADYLIKL